MARQDLVALFDIARILPDEQRLEVLQRADNGTRLPFQRRLTPAKQTGLVGFDPNENPVAHFRIADQRLDGRNFHWSSQTCRLFSRHYV